MPIAPPTPDSGPDTNTAATIDAAGTFHATQPGFYRVRATHASGARADALAVVLSPFEEPNPMSTGTATDGNATYAWIADGGRATHAELLGLDATGKVAALSGRVEVVRHADLSLAVLVPASALADVRPFVRFTADDGATTIALYPLAPHVAPEMPPAGGAMFLPNITITNNVGGS